MKKDRFLVTSRDSFDNREGFLFTCWKCLYEQEMMYLLLLELSLAIRLTGIVFGKRNDILKKYAGIVTVFEK